MNPTESRLKKAIILSFLFATQLFSFMIRLALGVVAPTLMKLYHISPKTMGYILSGWNWSYTAGLLFSGSIIDRLGPWISMGVGSAVWGLSTMALPLAGAAVSLFLMRMLFGMGQSILIPTTATSVARGFSPKERTSAIGIAFSGNVVGSAVGATLTAFLAARYGWHAAFYWLGGASLLMTLLWFGFFPDKRIGKTPADQTDGAKIADAKKASWLSLLRYRSTWGIAFGQLGYLYAYFFFVSWLPGYLVIQRHMTIMKSGLVASLPFWMGMVGTVGGGWMGDYLIQRGVKTMVSRKSIIGAGLGASTVFVIAAAYAQQSWLAVTLITLCVGSLRLATGSANSLPIDLAPRSAVGTLTSIQNFFGNIGGLLAPIVTGYVVSATGSFVGALVTAGAMALVGAASFVLLVGDPQKGRIEPGIAATAAQTGFAK